MICSKLQSLSWEIERALGKTSTKPSCQCYFELILGIPFPLSSWDRLLACHLNLPTWVSALVLCRFSDSVELICLFLITLPTILHHSHHSSSLLWHFSENPFLELFSAIGSLLSPQMDTPFTSRLAQLHIDTDKLSTH